MGGLMAKLKDALSEFTGSNPARVLMLQVSLFEYITLLPVVIKTLKFQLFLLEINV